MVDAVGLVEVYTSAVSMNDIKYVSKRPTRAPFDLLHHDRSNTSTRNNSHDLAFVRRCIPEFLEVRAVGIGIRRLF